MQDIKVFISAGHSNKPMQQDTVRNYTKSPMQDKVRFYTNAGHMLGFSNPTKIYAPHLITT
jgi:hypothetical protein